LRQAAAERDTLRVELAKVEQALALAAQTQRDADRQLQALALRQERLEQERSGLNTPDPQLVERLRGDCAAMEEQLEEAQAQLAELEARLPGLDDQRRQAQTASQGEAHTLAGLEARMAALSKLQEDVQKQGALQPWLERHGLAELGRLWQRVQIEAGAATGHGAVPRDRASGSELRDVDQAAALGPDALPARLALDQLPVGSAPAGAELSLRAVARLLRVNEAGLRTLLDDWL